MRIGKRLAKFLFWLMILVLSTLGGGLWFTYTYLTNSETAGRLIRQYAVRYLPRSALDTRVEISPLHGDLTLTKLEIRQRVDDTVFNTLSIPWMQIRVDPRKLFRGKIDMREIDVALPTLRLVERRDGTWNVQGLLADPWPGPVLEKAPPINIRNGTLELVTDDDALAGPSTQGSPPNGAVEAEDDLGAGDQTGADSPARPGSKGAVILRELNLRLDSLGELKFKFDGSAKGDLFSRLRIQGEIDFATGKLTMGGDLAGLTLSETFRRRLPAKIRPRFNTLSLNSGVVDVELSQLVYNPQASPDDQFKYVASARLREGVCDCQKLPFPLNDVNAQLDLADGMITIKHAQGSNGLTGCRAEGTFNVRDPTRSPLDLRITLNDLELDSRIRGNTPPEFADLWDLFKPRGRVDAVIQLTRVVVGGPIALGARVVFRDVTATYRYFPYELEHLTGELTLQGNKLKLDIATPGSSGATAHLKGEIDNPGKDAIVKLDVEAGSVPINEKLLVALPPDVRNVVDKFRPKGMVKVEGKVSRVPMQGKPEGDIKIDANIDLMQQCEIQWDGLPYLVRDLTGRLELHPDFWKFKEMRGHNGQALIKASGWVRKLELPKLKNGEDPLKVHVDLEAENLPFNDELRAALPPAWSKKTWTTINPSGASDIKGSVDIEPNKPDNVLIEIVPKPQSNARLEIARVAQQGIDPGGILLLPVEDVLGRFVFHNGTVTMSDVSLEFRGAPVQFAFGTVTVENTGRFDLGVKELRIKDLRIDADLRKKMPPLMGQFARKLDDGNTFTAHGDLKIGWSGVSGEPAWCQWEKTLVVFNNNTVKTGIPLEHINGELNNVSGWSNGYVLRVDGAMKLESVSLLGQQITRAESPFHIRGGKAELENLQAQFLGGEISGNGTISLDQTPRYSASLELRGAQLREYAKTIPGNQTYRGRVDGAIQVSGLGNDIRALQGRGEVHVSEGDLGELPVFLRLAQKLPIPRVLSSGPRERGGNAGFDSADIVFTIAHGQSKLDPIKFNGNAFSLEGDGTLDPQGVLDVRLKVLFGLHIPIISEIARESSSQIFMVRVKGTPAAPDYRVQPLPNLLRSPFRDSSD